MVAMVLLGLTDELSHRAFHTCISLKYGKLCGFQGAGMTAENDSVRPPPREWQCERWLMGVQAGAEALLSSPF